MTTQESVQSYTWAFELRDWLSQLRDRTFAFVLPCLYVLGSILLGTTGLLQQPSQGVVIPLATFFLILIVWLLHGQSPTAAAWAP